MKSVIMRFVVIVTDRAEICEQPTSRPVWLSGCEDARRARSDGVPLLGLLVAIELV